VGLFFVPAEFCEYGLAGSASVFGGFTPFLGFEISFNRVGELTGHLQIGRSQALALGAGHFGDYRPTLWRSVVGQFEF
jgi:hypothetical protein